VSRPGKLEAVRRGRAARRPPLTEDTSTGSYDNEDLRLLRYDRAGAVRLRIEGRFAAGSLFAAGRHLYSQNGGPTTILNGTTGAEVGAAKATSR
jgi:hypothetical protein